MSDCDKCGAPWRSRRVKSNGQCADTYGCGRDEGGPQTVPCLERQLAAAKAEIVELLETIMGEGQVIETGDKAGWTDTMALSHVRDAGERLVELGIWERHPDGYGRRWFYRRKPAARADAEGKAT